MFVDRTRSLFSRSDLAQIRRSCRITSGKLQVTDDRMGNSAASPAVLPRVNLFSRVMVLSRNQ
jgi:hypothetical protein